MRNSTALFYSPLGSVRVEAGAKGIVSAGFSRVPVGKKTAPARFLKKCIRQMNQYFKGSRTHFTVKLDLKGTPFQRKVWSELVKIPHGKTVSYLELARRISHPRSARAVGSAAGANPVCILVPCHRLVASKGLGGYAYGLPTKKKLLKLEASQ